MVADVNQRKYIVFLCSKNSHVGKNILDFFFYLFYGTYENDYKLF